MLNAAKNITAGILVGYGFTAFVYFGIMTQLWVDAAPHRPNKDLGLTPHSPDEASISEAFEAVFA